MIPCEPITLDHTTIHRIHSQIIDQTFRIEIAFPITYAQSQEHHPVVYVADGNWFLPPVTCTARSMQFARELPLMILVGIGYEQQHPLEAFSLRARDLTPTLDERWTREAREDALTPLPGSITPGGAGAFLEFINSKLKPFVNSHYRTDPENETLMGYSFGGLFALYVLFNDTESFDKYVVGSPSIYWDEGVLFRYEEQYAREHKDLDKRVFLSVGSLEESAGDPTGEASITNLITMTERLESRHYPSLVLEQVVLDEETHFSGIITAFNRGLRFVFREELPALR